MRKNSGAVWGLSLKTAIIDNRHVTCPYCHETIEVQRQTKGATYTKEWTSLHGKTKLIIEVWISHEILYTTIWTKPRLRRALSHFGLNISEDAINARISELKGLGLVRHEKPGYSLNIEKAAHILNRGGKLK